MKRATPAYADVLALVHAAAFPPGGRWGPDAIAMQLDLPGAFGWVDAAGGFVLARTAAEEAEILTLAVAPEARRTGLGRRLLRAAMTEAAARGATSMVLEVGENNVTARALYHSEGFAAVGRRSGYYAGGEDALILRVAM